MSVKLRFDYPADGCVVQRSCSFMRFSPVSGRRRKLSSNSFRSKALSGKSTRVHPSPSRMGASIWGQQPEQVDRIFQALRKGLKEYLDGHQTEMGFLSSQQRDTKRNSRLEIRALERYLRRLEFQISKVEELYETYCIQWRLCQGAVNMKKAFALSPSSRASRESLQELNRNHRHSLEDMCVMEGELEILLGELHIKMKGLIGFARLCPGDQYEVVIRLGRQRWKIRGKIQTDDRQSWDVEEMIFLAHIHENFDIKVTEVKGLGSLLVGMVMCKSADFFMSRPQLMVVDITELGTIKLQLEVVWNSGRARKTTSMVRQLQHDPEGSFSLVSRESRGVSLLSFLADTSQVLNPTPTYSQGGSQTQISLTEDLVSEGSPPEERTSRGLPGTSETGDEWPPSDPDTGLSSPSTPGETKRGSLLAQQQRYSTPDILRQNGGGTSPSSSPSPGRDTDTETVPIRSSKGEPGVEVEVRLGYEDFEEQEKEALARPVVTSNQHKAQALRISALLGELESALQGQECKERELRTLDNQILHLNTILKNDLSLLKSSSAKTLAVEEKEVLESFDFLSTDFNADEDVSCMGSVRLKDTGISSFQEGTLRSLGLFYQESQSRDKLDVATLTTGNYSLDHALETHLGICTLLLEALRSSESAVVHRDILEEMLLQAEVLEKVSRLMLETADMLSVNDSKQRELLVFWEECTSSESPLCCPTETFVQTLRKRYIHKVKAKQPGQPDAVFAQLLQQIQASCRMVPMACYSPQRVTVFQLSTYLSRWSFTDLGEHISRLSREVYLVSALESPKRRKALKKLKGRRIVELLPLGYTLKRLASLQTDANHKVSRAATNCLCRAVGYKAFRTKAIVYYTEILRDSNVQLQQAACLALKCLKATESVEQVAELWRSADEDLRSAARETVLSFGKKGHLAFQRMDKIYCELQEEAYQNLDTEITIL
uniref:RIPOR family member 3 n=1 Tax=Hucho hucho TaxID=62062 RepID=A0A4W5MCW5_9TELE